MPAIDDDATSELNIAAAHEAIAAAVPDRNAVVFRDRRFNAGA